MKTYEYKPRSIAEVDIGHTDLVRYWDVIANGTTANHETFANHNLVRFKRKMYDGVDIVGYHKFVRDGELMPHTPYVRFDSEMTGYSYLTSKSHEYWQTSTQKAFYRVNDDNHHGHINASLITDVMPRDLLGKLSGKDFGKYVQGAAAKIYNSGFDASTFVAELGDLRKSWYGILDDFVNVNRKVLKQLPKRIKRNPRRALTYLENAYLELRYGWRPLMYDIQEFEDTIRNFETERTRWSERVGESYSFTESYTGRPKGVYWDNTVEWDNVTTDVYTVSIRGNVTCDVTLDKWRTNAAVTAWERVPYSFMVDWLFTVGQSLSASSLLAIARDLTSSYGVKITLDRRQDCVGYANAGTSYWYAKNLSPSVWRTWATNRCELLMRQPYSVPISPQFNVNLDDWKVLDLLSILDQLSRGNKIPGHLTR